MRKQHSSFNAVSRGPHTMFEITTRNAHELVFMLAEVVVERLTEVLDSPVRSKKDLQTACKAMRFVDVLELGELQYTSDTEASRLGERSFSEILSAGGR